MIINTAPLNNLRHCDCGHIATVAVTVTIGAGPNKYGHIGRRVKTTTLYLCADCYDLMKQIEGEETT